MKRLAVIVFVAMLVVMVFAYTQLTLFVIQPIGVLPEGRTLVIWKREKTNFIDSADGICQRERGGVSLLCRMAVFGGIVASSDDIIARLPYSRALYLISTGGNEYDR